MFKRTNSIYIKILFCLVLMFLNGVLFQQSGIFCVLADTLIKGEVYSSYIQVFISTFYLFSLLLDLYFLLVFQFFLFFSSCNMLGCTLLIVSLYWYLILIFMLTLLSLTYLNFKILQEHLAPSGYLKLPNVSYSLLNNSKEIL